MSYVLDALKKADAERERERGAVPGLHAQPTAEPAVQREGTRAPQPWLWTALGAAVVTLGVLGWRLWLQPEAPPPAAAVPPAATHAPLPPVAQLPPPRAPEPEPPRPRAGAETTAAPQAAAAPPVPAKSSKPAGVPSAPGGDAAGEGRIVAMKELPEDIRRQLPQLVIGGSIYSDNPASRFLIINGQIFHEHDKLGPDLTLEQIHLKLAVLSFKGTRFRIAY